ncbi:MAG TPA: MlaD family protein [Chitinophagaceae bacterium]|nr:MlaD family protein [Chitinophagaceae bacterium]
MANNFLDNLKLGVFTLSGLLLLIFSLYMIGRTESLFGSHFELKAHFKNASGLTKGNNIRYSGIQVGTVKSVKFKNDTTIEVVMLIEERARYYIRKNALASIGTEGLMGNKVININPGKGAGEEVTEGDVILTQKLFDTDEIFNTLNKTNNNIATISEDLKSTVQRINNSTALWSILNENSLASNLKTALLNISKASSTANNMVNDLHTIINDVKNGKGSAGMLLKDTSFAFELKEAVTKVKSVGDSVNVLTSELNQLINEVNFDVSKGKGTVNALLKDSVITNKLTTSLENIKQGTAAFNENMEALKHNFFFRGYFRKLEKQKKKEAEAKK